MTYYNLTIFYNGKPKVYFLTLQSAVYFAGLAQSMGHTWNIEEASE